MTCRSALQTNARDPAAHRLLGTILQTLDRGGEAVTCFEEATRLDPGNPEAFRCLAIALSQEGRLSDAIAADRRALELNPRHTGALHHLVQLKTLSRDDPDFASLEALGQDEDSFDDSQLIGLFFALAKAYEDVGDVERSFGYLRRANALKREAIDYDVGEDVRVLARTAAVFQPALFDRFAGAGSRCELPILIVGMPRSGTSLVEQILASHPAVHGGGERQDLPQLASAVSLLNERGLPAPDGVPYLRASDFDRLGHAYASRLQRIAPGALRVTDKQPSNFRHLGLLHLMAPQARVIHCVRDPVDTCLSCYRLPFASVDYAFDLDELGRYYRAYEGLMEHWRAVLPNRTLEVSYEELVADVGRQARRIVGYCGLEWDDACLAFHTTERTVRTASFAQVRMPIYQHSVERWKRYRAHLGPLLNALELDAGPPASVADPP
jgi:tetratricopeptide (TPR) repeat protein